MTDPIELAARRCPTLAAWLTAVADTVHRELAAAGSSIVLALENRPQDVRRAFGGVARGAAREGLNDYFAHWADADPLATGAAFEMFEATGVASTRTLYPALEPAARRFVDEFLAGLGIAEQLSVRLDGNGTTNGYLTLHQPGPIPDATVARLTACAPRLSEQLRGYLPVGLGAPLSRRERQTAELITFGFSNREIAAVLHVGEDTVKKHVYRAIRKLGIDRRTQLAVAWTTGRLLALPMDNAGRAS